MPTAICVLVGQSRQGSWRRRAAAPLHGEEEGGLLWVCGVSGVGHVCCCPRTNGFSSPHAAQPLGDHPWLCSTEQEAPVASSPVVRLEDPLGQRRVTCWVSSL